LTDRIAAGARAYIARIDEMGGPIAALERGFQAREIADAAYETQRAIEEGRQKVVGVNCFEMDGESPVEVLAIDPRAEREQCERLAAYRAGRDAARTAAALAALDAAAGAGRNLMPEILGAVRAGATLGEIATALRRVYGEHREATFA
jgi:methylmalonyl-CoA mutase N-terminal domain/subunit